MGGGGEKRWHFNQDFCLGTRKVSTDTAGKVMVLVFVNILIY